MTCAFTTYVRDLFTGREPDGPAFEGVLADLGRVLRAEMWKRGLLRLRPRHLGISGYPTWNDEALEDLLLDCYAYIFVDRLKSLAAQAAVKTDIGGLVRLNVQHFLFETQKANDPVGLRVFEIARAAISALVQTGRLHLLSLDAEITNESVLAPKPWLGVQPIDASLVAVWVDRLMPDLVSGTRRQPVIDALANEIAKVNDSAFRFQDLVETLKECARQRWAALLFEGERVDSTPDSVPGDRKSAAKSWSLPETLIEQRQDARNFLKCLNQGIKKYSNQPPIADFLQKLLDFLCDWCAMWDEGSLPERFPSNQALAELLKIPRKQIPELKAILGELALSCRSGSGSGETKRGLRESEEPPMAGTTRREQLRQKSLALAQTKPPAEAAQLLSWPDSDLPLEWLELETEDGTWLVPIDAAPFIGPLDIDLKEEIGEPLIARPAFAFPLVAAIAANKSAALESVATRSIARAALEPVKAGLLAAKTAAIAPIDEPEERAWLDRVRAEKQRLEGRFAADSAQAVIADQARSATIRPRRRPFRWVEALAAGFAVVTLGLSVWVRELKQSAKREPLLFSSRSAGEIPFGVRDLEIRVVALDARHAALYLIFEGVAERNSYELRLIELPKRTTLWTKGVGRDEQILILPLDPQQPRPLRYFLELWGRDSAGQMELLGAQAVTID